MKRELHHFGTRSDGRLANVRNILLGKTPTGSSGLDEITGGRNRRDARRSCAAAPGSGKTLVGLGVLINCARQFGEPGVLIGFEESAGDLACDVASFGEHARSN